MTKKSAGILVYKESNGKFSVFLVHPGGPFWAKKDMGAWSIPKGEFSDEEDGLVAARREFEEETSQNVDGDFIELTPRKQPSRKIVYAWAVEGKVDEQNVKSNEFEMMWPPKSGTMQRFPEVDRGVWFPIEEAMQRIHPGQIPFLEELIVLLGLEPIEPREETKKSQGELF